MTHSFRAVVVAFLLPLPALAQEYGKPDRAAPGDELIQSHLRAESVKLDAQYPADLASRDAWEASRAKHYEDYLYMLGLSPRPEKTPLKAAVTRTLDKGDYVVEMLHYQSRPGLYVTGNLYRPAKVNAGEKLPAVFYVCGHSNRARNGNKVAYQSHGIWFARHGYVCLVVDSLQLGEIGATHHGTYSLGRWWWHSRGYTPAGVEAWNGVRGIDYLQSRPDVDPDRIAVTGISGGGAATFWIAAADDRVKVAVPVSGMADLESYVGNRVINGHCDCMFLYNARRWPWTRIAGLIAPRPMLFTNSDKDPIYPMDANDRVIARLERLYSLYGASDRVDAFVSVGGHAYRPDIRQAAYRFINTHLKNDPRPITDSEVDIVSEGNRPGAYPIPPEQLRVFPTDADLPTDQLNTKIDETFVPMAKVAPPAAGGYDAWRKDLLAKVRQTSFAFLPEPVAAPRKIGEATADGWQRVRAEGGVDFRMRHVAPTPGAAGGDARNLTGPLLVVLNEDEAGPNVPAWAAKLAGPAQTVILVEPSGVGATKWTRKNPPNYVERSHVLLGHTVDAARVRDVLAAAKAATAASVAGVAGGTPHVHVAGRGAAGVLAAYAAALDDQTIAGVTLIAPPASHMDSAAPQFLNILRTADIPDTLGLIAPRPLTITGVADPAAFAKTKAAYDAAGAAGKLTIDK